jgi:hypothetical protein
LGRKGENKMKPNLLNKTLNLFVAIAMLVVALGTSPPAAVLASPIRSQSISADTTWSTNQVLTSDVVVENGATLTIAEGVEVMVDATNPDPAPSGDGLSPKVEIIVKSGGELVIQKGASVYASSVGGWYGIVFLSGSFGEINEASIALGTVGITIEGASPIIQNNSIQLMQGDSSVFTGWDGGLAAGIVITGTSTAQVISNTLSDITGGDGTFGASGADGIVGGGAGSPGEKGGDGGRAIGIQVTGGATPTVIGNTIAAMWGGNGGDGGYGGNGTDGWSFNQTGGDGGDGAYGGSGGLAAGIMVQTDGVGPTIQHNTIGPVVGGSGGNGGDGGAAGDGYDPSGDAFLDGGNGGDGGNGVSAGSGGEAFGIAVQSGPVIIASNLITAAIVGGSGGFGGWGGAGGEGGQGDTPALDNGQSGGAGGDGGAGGSAGASGSAGDAAGIIYAEVSNPLRNPPRDAVTSIAQNRVLAEVACGNVIDGGQGGAAGIGGNGGDGYLAATSPSHGGAGGSGGAGGDGGDAGTFGTAYGIKVDAKTLASVARNQVSWVTGTASAGLGGNGAPGGAGGNGGNGGSGAFPGNGGDGGDGGQGGVGGWGGEGGVAMGTVFLGQLRVENNMLYNVIGGPGAAGGAGGDGGDGGTGGTGVSAGLVGGGAAGGDGGRGGDGGYGMGMHVFDAASGSEVVNNTVADSVPGYSVGGGGSGGQGGTDGDSVGVGTGGQAGADGDYDSNVGISVVMGQATLVNNIVAITGLGAQGKIAAPAPSYGILVSALATVTLDYNNVRGWDQNYDGVTAGPHDISDVSEFVNSGAGDYHLSGISPCIDAGTSTFTGLTLPTDDFDGETRPQGDSHDIGADEFPSGPPCTPLTGVTISGPMTGETGVEYSFSAVVSPSNADAPIAYTWAPPPSSGQGTEAVKYTWTTAGTKDIQINVSNCGGGGVATYKHTITITAPPPTTYELYLPLIMQKPKK